MPWLCCWFLFISFTTSHVLPPNPSLGLLGRQITPNTGDPGVSPFLLSLDSPTMFPVTSTSSVNWWPFPPSTTLPSIKQSPASNTAPSPASLPSADQSQTSSDSIIHITALPPVTPTPSSASSSAGLTPFRLVYLIPVVIIFGAVLGAILAGCIYERWRRRGIQVFGLVYTEPKGEGDGYTYPGKQYEDDSKSLSLRWREHRAKSYRDDFDHLDDTKESSPSKYSVHGRRYIAPTEDIDAGKGIGRGGHLKGAASVSQIPTPIDQSSQHSLLSGDDSTEEDGDVKRGRSVQRVILNRVRHGIGGTWSKRLRSKRKKYGASKANDEWMSVGSDGEVEATDEDNDGIRGKTGKVGVVQTRVKKYEKEVESITLNPSALQSPRRLVPFNRSHPLSETQVDHSEAQLMVMNPDQPSPSVGSNQSLNEFIDSMPLHENQQTRITRPSFVDPPNNPSFGLVALRSTDQSVGAKTGPNVTPTGVGCDVTADTRQESQQLDTSVSVTRSRTQIYPVQRRGHVRADSNSVLPQFTTLSLAPTSVPMSRQEHGILKLDSNGSFSKGNPSKRKETYPHATQLDSHKPSIRMVPRSAKSKTDGFPFGSSYTLAKPLNNYQLPHDNHHSAVLSPQPSALMSPPLTRDLFFSNPPSELLNRGDIGDGTPLTASLSLPANSPANTPLRTRRLVKPKTGASSAPVTPVHVPVASNIDIPRSGGRPSAIGSPAERYRNRQGALVKVDEIIRNSWSQRDLDQVPQSPTLFGAIMNSLPEAEDDLGAGGTPSPTSSQLRSGNLTSQQKRAKRLMGSPVVFGAQSEGAGIQQRMEMLNRKERQQEKLNH